MKNFSKIPSWNHFRFLHSLGHLKATIILALFATAFCGNPFVNYAQQSAEQKKIKEIIHAGITAYFAKDVSAWESQWLQEDEVTRTLLSNGYYSNTKGWSNFGPEMIKTLGESTTEPFTLEIENEVIYTDKHLAWAEFDQILTLTNRKPVYKEVSRQHRVLTKKDGEWKVISQITINKQTFENTPEAIESSLLMAGYKMLEAEEAKKAFEIFKMTSQLYRES
ncbi:MAG: hypothetical protein WDZ72_04415, partial [Cyclobacteriaceae bacterium]